MNQETLAVRLADLVGSHPITPTNFGGVEGLTGGCGTAILAARFLACIRGQLRESAGPVPTVVAFAEITIAGT